MRLASGIQKSFKKPQILCARRYIANETVYFTDSGSLPIFTNSTLECPHTFSNNKVKMFWKVFHQNSTDNMDINIHSAWNGWLTVAKKWYCWPLLLSWYTKYLRLKYWVLETPEVHVIILFEHIKYDMNLDAIRTAKYMHHWWAHKILKRGDLTQDSSHGKQSLHV